MRPLTTGLLLGVLLLGACRQIIGIEDANPEPPLSAGGASAGNSTATAGVGGSSAGDAPGGTNPDPAGGNGAAGAAPTGASGADAVDGGAPGAAGAPAVEPTLCERYCTTVMDNCSGSLAVYNSVEMCLSVCAVLPPGQVGDAETHVSSVHCRLEAAEAAGISEPEYSCPIAAPGGNGQCGTNCENLCLMRQAVCSPYLTGTASECLEECATLEDLGGYTLSPDAKPLHTRGGHVQCRLYHVSAAATDEPDTHCLHADGASPCIDL